MPGILKSCAREARTHIEGIEKRAPLVLGALSSTRAHSENIKPGDAAGIMLQ